MSKINVLTEQIANKIAAGEVVERPASVVKELIENSIDANSKYITIEIKNGGISYIRVSDDGNGIMKDDTVIAFERHATSKIITENDLTSINTLGFRGEALSSIASVSQVELITMNINEDIGSNVVIKGGALIENQEIGCPKGTTVTVRNLFFNTPARMKFLKKDSTEAGYISDLVNRFILANPEISFKYINNGKEIVYSSGDNNLKNCVYTVYGKDYSKNMIKVDYEANGIKITGLIGNQSISRANRTFQSFFINKRYVKSNVFTYALQEGYKNSIMVNKFPVAILDININPLFVDVNVHPTKMEVKFSNDKHVFDTIYWAVKNALNSQRDIPEMNITNKNYQYIPTKSELGLTENRGKIVFEQSKSNEIPSINAVKKFIPSESIKQQEFKIDSDECNTDNGLSIKKEEIIVDDIQPKEEQIEFKIIGQLFSTYIIIEKNDNMILIDQHAAHERLKYEKILKEFKEGDIFPQRLLTPVVIVVSPTELDVFNNNNKIFDELGFEVEEFGNNSIIVRQSPVAVEEELIKKMICDILNLIKSNNSNLMTGLEEKILYSIACKAAIKGNSKLNFEEMRSLVIEVLNTKNVNTCPHGRPIMISISKYKVEKEFKRVGL